MAKIKLRRHRLMSLCLPKLTHRSISFDNYMSRYNPFGNSSKNTRQIHQIEHSNKIEIAIKTGFQNVEQAIESKRHNSKHVNGAIHFWFFLFRSLALSPFSLWTNCWCRSMAIKSRKPIQFICLLDFRSRFDSIAA